MIGILYSILIFFDKTSEKKEFNKNNRIKTVVAILLIINFFCRLWFFIFYKLYTYFNNYYINY